MSKFAIPFTFLDHLLTSVDPHTKTLQVTWAVRPVRHPDFCLLFADKLITMSAPQSSACCLASLRHLSNVSWYLCGFHLVRYLMSVFLEVAEEPQDIFETLLSQQVCLIFPDELCLSASASVLPSSVPLSCEIRFCQFVVPISLQVSTAVVSL